VDGIGNVQVNQETDLDVNTSVRLSAGGQADLRYGTSNIFTIYAPQDGTGTMRIDEWNGARRISVQAGAGYVVEDSSEAKCTLSVVQAGDVQLTSLGTEYAFSVNPQAQQVVVGVISGSVQVMDTGQNVYSVNGQQALQATNGIVGGVFDLQMTSEEARKLFDQGLDLFGGPIHAPEEAPPVPAVTLSLWIPWDPNTPEGKGFLEMVSNFTSKYPDIHIETNYVPYGEMTDRYRVSFAAGDAPSMFITTSDDDIYLYDDGLVSDLLTPNLYSDQLSNSLASIMTDPFGQAMVYNQSILIGLPFRSFGVVMYRNNTIFQKAPRLYEELLEMSKSIPPGRAGPVGMYMDLGFYFSGANLFAFPGGRLMDEEGLPAFANDPGVAWLQRLRSFNDYGLTCSNCEDDAKLFESGQVGIIVDGTWNLERFERNLGEQNLSIDPWPGGLSGFLQTYMLYVNPDITVDQRKAVNLFMVYLLTDEAQSIPIGRSLVPVLSHFSVDDQHIQQILEAIRHNWPLPRLPQMQFYWGPLDEAISSAVYEGVDPLEALKRAEDEINASLHQ
jgi:ABC-type glycerol-3-phosphate transport system substrate-binding protein